MNKTCAIFDLDGTLIRQSSEKVFLKHLLKHGEIPISNLLAWTSHFFKVKSYTEAKSNKIHLYGLEQRHLCELARECFVDSLRDSITPHISTLIDTHRNEGRTVIIMSGSLSFLVELFHEHFQTDIMVADELEVADGKFTGGRVGLRPYAQNKAALAQELATTHGFDLSTSYAYGNHHSDVYKLELFGNPVAVNPDRELRRIATERNWQIEF
jgi:HAD superfamily hydrolase (TIGR01490 family)